MRLQGSKGSDIYRTRKEEMITKHERGSEREKKTWGGCLFLHIALFIQKGIYDFSFTMEALQMIKKPGKSEESRP